MSRHTPSQVVIITDFAEVRGGASGLARRQAELMAERGLKVTMIAGDRHPAAPPEVDLVSLGRARLLETSPLRAASRGLWDGSVSRRLADWIAQNDTESTIYHVHGFQQTLSPAVLAPLKKRANRVVIQAHDYFLACPNGAFFDYPANHACTREALGPSCLSRNCDKNSRAQKLWRVTRQVIQNRAMADLLPEASVILPRAEMAIRLGLNGRVVVVPNPAEALPMTRPIPSRQRNFVYVGDLNRYKGVFLLAEAARRASVPLVFVGDGAEREALASGWPEHRMTGWADRSAIAAELSVARALVAPSLGPEPFGLAPVEALLSGIPVILAEGMLIAREVRTQGAGLSFAAGNMPALVEALRRAAQDDHLIDTLSMNAVTAGSALSLPIHDWIEALLDVYDDHLPLSALTPNFPRHAEMAEAAE